MTARVLPGIAPYRSPRWLLGGHAQTIYPYFLPRPAIAYRRERVATRDGDFWDFDWVDAPGARRARGAPPATAATRATATPPPSPAPPAPVASHAPVVVLFHGLEGSARSHYARGLMKEVAARGWCGVVAHFRGCGGTPNLLPRAYHSGDHEDIDEMLRAVRERIPDTATLHAVGVSVGGSALINWLGRAGTTAARTIASAAAVSVPLDLTAAGIAIGHGLNRIYTAHFLHTLKPKALAMSARFRILDADRIRAAHSMWQFDEAVTAPLHGFRGADDYWARASSKPWLGQVAVPTLVLNARNDPFVPAASLPGPREVSRCVVLEQPDAGGHAGFMTGPAPGHIDWLPRRIVAFLDGIGNSGSGAQS